MVKVQSFVEYFNIVKEIKQNCHEDEILFYRGVADSSFDLLPGIKFENKGQLGKVIIYVQFVSSWEWLNWEEHTECREDRL